MNTVRLTESELVKLIKKTLKEEDTPDMGISGPVSLESLSEKIDELTTKVDAQTKINKDTLTVVEEFYDIWGLTGGGM
jgi:hypothetical protein